MRNINENMADIDILHEEEREGGDISGQEA